MSGSLFATIALAAWASLAAASAWGQEPSRDPPQAPAQAAGPSIRWPMLSVSGIRDGKPAYMLTVQMQIVAENAAQRASIEAARPRIIDAIVVALTLFITLPWQDPAAVDPDLVRALIQKRLDDAVGPGHGCKVELLRATVRPL